MLSPSEDTAIRVRIIAGEKEDWENKETKKKMEGCRRRERKRRSNNKLEEEDDVGKGRGTGRNKREVEKKKKVEEEVLWRERTKRRLKV
jgi:hypothetical protein